MSIAGFAPRGTVSREILASRGLAESWRDVRTLDDVARCEVIGAGPDGHPGLCVSALPVVVREPPRRLGFYPDEKAIVWEQLGPDLWGAIDREFPPTPEDLARPKLTAGHAVMLDDGRMWVVPVIRRFDGGCGLPQRAWWDSSGQFCLDPKPDYRELWEMSAEAEALFSTPGAKITYERGIAMALAFLGLNYRIGKPEQTLIGLIHTGNFPEILSAAIDGPKVTAYLEEIEAARKKNDALISAPPSPNGTPGDADSCPPTPQAAETSGSCE